MPQVPPIDLVGLAWFILVWLGYTLYTDRGAPRRHSLRAAMHRNRYRWMTQVLSRENRIADASILGQLASGASFFASTTALILVGLFTVLGATNEAVGVLRQIPFAGRITPNQWELPLSALTVVLVHAVFQLTWAV